MLALIGAVSTRLSALITLIGGVPALIGSLLAPISVLIALIGGVLAPGTAQSVRRRFTGARQITIAAGYCCCVSLVGH